MINKIFIDEIKKQINELISELEKVADNDKYQDVGSSGEDNATEFEDFEERVALMNQAKKELKDLRQALTRIERDKYGFCEKCSEPIESGRLKAFPASRFCSSHAK